MDGYVFPIRTLRLIRRADKDAKGIGGHDRSGTPVQPCGEDVPGNPCITVPARRIRPLSSTGKASPFYPNEQWYFR
jgi:hypothetical protein